MYPTHCIRLSTLVVSSVFSFVNRMLFPCCFSMLHSRIVWNKIFVQWRCIQMSSNEYIYIWMQKQIRRCEQKSITKKFKLIKDITIFSLYILISYMLRIFYSHPFMYAFDDVWTHLVTEAFWLCASHMFYACSLVVLWRRIEKWLMDLSTYFTMRCARVHNFRLYILANISVTSTKNHAALTVYYR